MELSPKQEGVLASVLSLFLLLGSFDYIGWAAVFFPLVLLPLGLYRASRRFLPRLH